ncbi:MAG: hypothetical protein IKH12_03295 [Clostridia bacterium]|nr:hypothetical protein [Clostridia bacterium]
MKKLISLLLAAVLLCTLAPAALAAAEEPFVPVLRFIACSDSHVKADSDRTFDRIGAMLSQAYALADGDSVYSNLDALLMAGDLTHNGTKEEFRKYWNAVSAAKRDETEYLGLVAKNHDGWHMTRKQMRACFSDLTGGTPDFHKVVCGYHFIGLSASDTDGIHYTKAQLSWLREQLDLAVADTPGKPVFFAHHEHNRNTVYGSSTYDGWGVKFFNKILKDYPQVVDFSGHSHYPLNDPRSVWQGDFTAIGTGALFYAEFTIDDDRAYDPPDCEDAGTYWIVEVNEQGDLHLRGFDVDADKLLCEYIEALKDKVVIEWGKGTLSWMQNWTTEKEVKRIEQKGDVDGIPPFSRYEDVILNLPQLRKVVEDKDWQSKLESLNCVYLILDKATGKQYVGVTYRDVKHGVKNGILSRWTEYANTGHGNNKMLVELLSKEGIGYAEQYFQWTILETLSLNVTQKVAIDRETLYKEKFGTRKHGYNEN